MADVREEVRKLLLDTKREGIEDLVDYLDEIGFYTAPASTRFHGAEVGALAQHSINVMDCARSIAIALCGKKWYQAHQDSITICALLHDLGKAGQFGKPLYIDNILKSGKPSDAQPFKTNDELKTLPHEIVSVVEATKFIDLTEEEQRAIAWHNGLYGIFKYEIQGKEDELYLIVHDADMWASRIVEREDK
jgi:23S rRNA maturation-related 3'-5' exoribonuclease YhaM